MTGHGTLEEAITRQYAIARAFFDLPLEEKTRYLADTARGEFRGYKARAVGELVVKDNDERYNIPKFTPEHERPHPKLILDHWEEIKTFSLMRLFLRTLNPELPLIVRSISTTRFFSLSSASLPTF